MNTNALETRSLTDLTWRTSNHRQVEDVPVEVIRVSLFFRQKLMVLMLDMSMACTVSKFSNTSNPDVVCVNTANRLLNCATDSGSFEGSWLLWEVPQVIGPLVGEEVSFESKSIRLGVDGVLLDESMAAARGLSVVQHGQTIQIGVPFGAEGGYRKVCVW